MFKSREKLFFVHIPKNAGNSIRPVCRKERIKVITHNIRRKHKRLLADYRGKRKVHAFCISRNPYDRVVSAYYYLMEKTTHKKDLAEREIYLAPFNGFNDFVKNGLEEAAKNQLHFLPQVFWIRNKEGKPEIESILRMEKLQNDFDNFCRKMDLKPRLLEVTNPSGHQHWETFYDTGTKDIVYNIYREDFEFFNYAK